MFENTKNPAIHQHLSKIVWKYSKHILPTDIDVQYRKSKARKPWNSSRKQDINWNNFKLRKEKKP